MSNWAWLEGMVQFGKEGHIKDVLSQYSVCISNFKVISYSPLKIQSLTMFSTTNKQGKSIASMFLSQTIKLMCFGCLI